MNRRFEIDWYFVTQTLVLTLLYDLPKYVSKVVSNI